MFRYIAWRHKLWQLERAYRADVKGTERAIAAAPEDTEAIAGGSDAEVLRYKIREAMTERLTGEADRLRIPLPERSDSASWDFGSSTGDMNVGVLTATGINDLRGAIRAERKARAERVLMWTSGLTGLIGALTGLISVWGK